MFRLAGAPMNQLTPLKFDYVGRLVGSIHCLSHPMWHHDDLRLSVPLPVAIVDAFFGKRKLLVIGIEGWGCDRFTRLPLD